VARARWRRRGSAVGMREAQVVTYAARACGDSAARARSSRTPRETCGKNRSFIPRCDREVARVMRALVLVRLGASSSWSAMTSAFASRQTLVISRMESLPPGRSAVDVVRHHADPGHGEP